MGVTIWSLVKKTMGDFYTLICSDGDRPLLLEVIWTRKNWPQIIAFPSIARHPKTPKTNFASVWKWKKPVNIINTSTLHLRKHERRINKTAIHLKMSINYLSFLLPSSFNLAFQDYVCNTSTKRIRGSSSQTILQDYFKVISLHI